MRYVKIEKRPRMAVANRRNTLLFLAIAVQIVYVMIGLVGRHESNIGEYKINVDLTSSVVARGSITHDYWTSILPHFVFTFSFFSSKT